MTVYVLGFAFSSSGSSVVLINKTKPAWQAGKLNGVGGKVEPGEFSLEAMVREFQEETGVQTELNAWSRIAHLQTKPDNQLTSKAFGMVVYSLFDDAVTNNVKTTTEEVVGLYDVLDVPELVLDGKAISNLSWLIGIAQDMKHQSVNGHMFNVVANYE